MSFVEEIFSLKNKVAVVIGGTGMLGSEIAKGLGFAGSKIIICGRKNLDEITEKLRQLGIECEGEYLDVFDINKIEEVAEKIFRKYRKIDILVNAAGGNIKEATTSKDVSFFDIPLSAIEKVVALNLFGGAILPCQIFGKYMVKNENGGSIINISSMNAFRPLTKIFGYSAAKAAVSNFTQWLAVHFALEYNKKLRVNAIAPGFFLTEQNRYLLIDEKGDLTERGKSIILHTPMGRFGKPEELIGICIFLASDASSFITGTVIPVDGGFNAYSGV